MSSSIAPFLIFFAGAVLVALTRGWARSVVLLAVPIVGALNLWALDGAEPVTVGLLDYTLTIVRADRLSMLFGYVFHLAAFLGFIFALHLKDTTESVSSMLYAGSALGAVFAGDMITLFIFWELMVVTSVFLILARRTERARAAAMRYLLIQVLSGVILLSGVLIRAYETGSIAFDFIGWSGLSSSLILLAFGIKAAFPLLHNWLQDAYPEATVTGTVVLSVFTTKLAIYALARGFAGTDLLCYRADAPPALVDRQTAHWQPVLDWAAVRFDAALPSTLRLSLPAAD